MSRVGGTFTCPPTPPMGIILSPSSELFPQRLADKAHSAQFVDMREFLTDIVALLQQLEVVPGTSAASCLPGVARSRLRVSPHSPRGSIVFWHIPQL